ncbi:MAG: helix-turn-helix transcriptional regulator [Lachnospiraceae bacterium]|nr:helix-turn-helix transcriptional regulator [Lachnospiraceae bacterium]
MKFTTRLENLLEERNLTQKFLSTELNIAPSTLNGYLRQNREPDFDTLINLANFFGVSIDYLLGITNIRNPYILNGCYDDNEEDLLETYRALGPLEQDYLLKQAHIYCQHDLDVTPPKKK